MENLPLYIPLVFGLTTAATVFLFYRASRGSKPALFIILGWMVAQALIALPGFYLVTDTMPPRFLLAIGPPLAFILFLFLSKKGRAFIDGLDNGWLTILHAIRVPVEIVLFWLFLYKGIPKIMTFEGQNLDILSGISAILVWYFMYVKGKFHRGILLAWNLVCLGLLINIVSIAVLAAPLRFQQLAFEQPNVGVFYFPFIWLPAVVVPLVLLSQLASIRRLVRERNPVSKLTMNPAG